MSVKDILKLIEEVAPDDTAKMDEIDARVWCYFHRRHFKAMMNNPYPKAPVRYSFYNSNGLLKTQLVVTTRKYTRSRDALKAIRPEGYVFRVECHSVAMDRWSCRADKITDYIEEIRNCGWIKTEELAELHAILQAIEFERSQTPTAPTDSGQTE